MPSGRKPDRSPVSYDSMAMKWVAQTEQPATRPVNSTQAARTPCPGAVRILEYKRKAVKQPPKHTSPATTTRRRSCSVARHVNTLNTLNSEYSAIEFDFGRTERIDRINQTVYTFDEETSKFIYDDQILNTNFYQIATKENTSLKRFNKEKNKEVSYGEIIDDFKIVTLIEKKIKKKGLRFKTTINDEVVYIDIE